MKLRVERHVFIDVAVLVVLGPLTMLLSILTKVDRDMKMLCERQIVLVILEL
jgi:hypothetical protein